MKRTTQPRRSNSAAIASRSTLARDAEGRAAAGRERRLTQHERVVQPLLPAAQVQRVVAAIADDEAEQIDVEALGRGEVRDHQLRVGGAHDVERRRGLRCGEYLIDSGGHLSGETSAGRPAPVQDSSGSPSRGIVCLPSATWIISVSQ